MPRALRHIRLLVRVERAPRSLLTEDAALRTDYRLSLKLDFGWRFRYYGSVLAILDLLGVSLGGCVELSGESDVLHDG